MVRGLKALTLTVLCIAPAVHGAPIHFDEATSGDLGINPCSPASMCPFRLDLGANTFAGTVTHDFRFAPAIHDFDVIEFMMPTAVRLRVRYEILSVTQLPTYSAPSEISFLLNPLVINGAPPVPEPYCQLTETNWYRTYDPSTGDLLEADLFDCIVSTPDIWRWRFGSPALRSSSFLEYSYRATLLLTPVPEPGTLALLTFGLLGLGVSRRKA